MSIMTCKRLQRQVICTAQLGQPSFRRFIQSSQVLTHISSSNPGYRLFHLTLHVQSGLLYFPGLEHGLSVPCPHRCFCCLDLHVLLQRRQDLPLELRLPDYIYPQRGLRGEFHQFGHRVPVRQWSSPVGWSLYFR